MPEKVSKAMVWRRLVRMQLAGMDVDLDGAFGKYKVTNRSGSRNLSGRMKTVETLYWLDAYEQGWDARRGHPAVEAISGKESAADGGGG